MADEKYVLPQDPQYRADNMRKLQDTDPVNASEVVNPTLIEPILESLAYLNKHKAELTADGKVPASQLPETISPTEVDSKIASAIGILINGAPETGDTLMELFDLIGANSNAMEILNAAIAGKAAADHTHSATDLGVIPADQKGTANGIATLDDSGKVPADQLPSMDYIPTSQKGAAGGVASLDGSGKVPETMLPVQGGLVAQATAPSNTKLGWIDTGSGNILKYYNGSAWAPIGSVWG